MDTNLWAAQIRGLSGESVAIIPDSPKPETSVSLSRKARRNMAALKVLYAFGEGKSSIDELAAKTGFSKGYIREHLREQAALGTVKLKNRARYSYWERLR